MIEPDPPSTNMRALGPSRRYGLADMPARFRRWHAPRANRWERLCVDAGRIDVQWLDETDVEAVSIAAGQSRWIAPGVRWRVIHVASNSIFHLEIHADESDAASAPQVVRAAWLDDAPRLYAMDGTELSQRLAELSPGRHCLLRASFDAAPALRSVVIASDGRLNWHPLANDSAGTVAVLMRSAQPIDLCDYLGRDHALIEAVLAGALRGDAEHHRWLQNLLTRHLVIEEDMLFPAWLALGGRPGWERGLRNEHTRLRADLQRLDDPVSQRRFLLLLDGHDEKEEQIVYPDIVARLASRLPELTAQVWALGVPNGGCRDRSLSRPSCAG